MYILFNIFQKKLYDCFRNNKEQLDDDNFAELEKPSVIIYLCPYQESNHCYSLPQLENSVIAVQKNMTISNIQNYLSDKLNIPPNQIVIMFNYQILDSKRTIEDIQLSFKSFHKNLIFSFRKLE